MSFDFYQHMHDEKEIYGKRVYLYDKYILMSAYGKMAGLRRITIILFGVCGKALKAK